MSTSTFFWTQLATFLVLNTGIALMGLPRSTLTKAGLTLRWVPVLAMLATCEAILVFSAWLGGPWAVIPGSFVALVAGAFVMQEVRVPILRRQRLAGVLPVEPGQAVVPKGKVLVREDYMTRLPVLFTYRSGDTYTVRGDRVKDLMLDHGESTTLWARGHISSARHRKWHIENHRGKPRIRKE